MALGAISIAEHVHRVAERYPIYVALHTDHCQADKLDKFVMPLMEETERRRAAGQPNLFNSHMFDGSALPLKDNSTSRSSCWNGFNKSDRARDRGRGRGRGGGRGQGQRRAQSSTPPRRTPWRWLAASTRFKARAIFLPPPSATSMASTSRAVKLKPSILKDCQDAVVKAYGERPALPGLSRRLRIRARGNPRGARLRRGEDEPRHRHPVCLHPAIAEHMFRNYDGVLKVDGEVGNKKAYDPRTYLAPRRRPWRSGSSRR